MAKKRPPNRTETLPNGAEVCFWDSIGVDGKGQRRRYRVGGVDGELVPSVSTVAGVFAKQALTPAAVKIQEEGIIALAQTGVEIGSLRQPQLRAKLADRGLHYDSIWGLARQRGDEAHDMLLDLFREGKVANLQHFNADVRPWLAAGLKAANREGFKPLDVEYLVASTEHGFAGRGDLLARLRDGRLARIDWKTVSRWYFKRDKDGNPTEEKLPPYDENLIALAGYELAAVESGYPPSDVRLIVRLGPDGEYEVTESHATEEVFLAALTAYNEKRYLAKGRPQELAA